MNKNSKSSSVNEIFKFAQHKHSLKILPYFIFEGRVKYNVNTNNNINVTWIS